jgi:ATP-dependent Clp protease protease subunit
MSLLKLPELNADYRLPNVNFDMRSDVMERWQPEIMAASEGDATISMYEAIGEGWDGSGVTAKRISAALRSIGDKDVTVNINSPGGNFFEGVAIYNLLKNHKHKVTVNVLGLAASAASVIAMAGDEILMGDGSFLMIHNAWAVTVGNRHDLIEASKQLEPFDKAMAQLYASRTGISEQEAAALMDAETWLDADASIEKGFATSRLDSSSTSKSEPASKGKKALAMVETAMAKAGYSRNSRRETLQALFSGMPSAAKENTTPCAGDEVAALLRSLQKTIAGQT